MVGIRITSLSILCSPESNILIHIQNIDTNACTRTIGWCKEIFWKFLLTENANLESSPHVVGSHLSLMENGYCSNTLEEVQFENKPNLYHLLKSFNVNNIRSPFDKWHPLMGGFLLELCTEIVHFFNQRDFLLVLLLILAIIAMQDKDPISSPVGCTYFWCWSCLWNDGCCHGLLDWGIIIMSLPCNTLED